MLGPFLFFLGSVLLFAAVSKAWKLISDPTFGFFTSYPRWLLTLAVVCETVLFVLLFTSIATPIKWLAYLAFFVVLFIVSFTGWALGLPTCPCFGTKKLPIWVTLTFNIMAIILLIVLRPETVDISEALQNVWNPIPG